MWHRMSLRMSTISGILPETTRQRLRRLSETYRATLFASTLWCTSFSTSFRDRLRSQLATRCSSSSDDTTVEIVVVAANTRCLQCNKKTDIGPGNAVIHLYKYQPWFSWLEVICTRCGETSRMFFGPGEWYNELISLGQLSVGYIAEDYCPEDMVKSFEEIYKLSPIEEVELTPRQETYIQFFAYLLDRGETI